MSEWYEDEGFWESFAPFMFTDARVGDMARQEVDQVVALLNLAPGAAILDLCCGPGRHALELARRGFSVTGVDRTAAYLNRAREQAGNQILPVEFVRCDMREFRGDGAFDAAINLFTSFGFFESDEESLKVLRNVHASLRPGGTFVIDVMGKEVIARSFSPRSWQSTPDGTAFFLEERTIRSGWSHIDNRWIVIEGADRRDYRFSLRVYSGHELAELLQQAGFSSVMLYGSLSAKPYDHEAQRLVAVSRK